MERKKRFQKGSIITEFAIVFPIFIFVMIGLADLSKIYFLDVMCKRITKETLDLCLINNCQNENDIQIQANIIIDKYKLNKNNFIINGDVNIDFMSVYIDYNTYSYIQHKDILLSKNETVRRSNW